MNSLLSSGRRVNVTTPAGGMTSGVAVLIGALFGIAMNTTLVGQPNVVVRDGEHTQAKATGETWAIGDIVYWDNTNKRLTKTSSGNTKVGLVSAAALSADATGSFILVPSI